MQGAAPALYNFEVCKLQQQLLRTRLFKLHGSFAVLARTFDIHHRAFAETLMLNDIADLYDRGLRRR